MSGVARETQQALQKNIFDEGGDEGCGGCAKKPAPEPTTLREAAEQGQLATAITLYAQGHDVHEKYDGVEETPLFWACLRGHIGCVRFFIERGADVNAVDNRSHTPLMWAATENRLEVAQLLLENGADLTAMDSRDCDVYFLAAQHGHLGFLHLLHTHKPMDLKRVDKDNHDIFVWAAYMNHLPVCRYLHEIHGATPGTPDYLGRTALHWAAREGAAAVCAYLMGLGLSPAQKDKEGKTALEWAQERNHFEAANALKAKQTTPLTHLRGTIAAVCSRVDYALMFAMGIIGVLGVWGVLTRFVVGAAPLLIFAPLMTSKNVIYSALYKMPKFNTKPEAENIFQEIGAPKTLIAALRGPESTRYRDPLVLAAIVTLLGAQFATIITDAVEVPFPYYGLGASYVFFLAVVKMRSFADVVPAGSILDDPMLKAVEQRKWAEVTEERIFHTPQHLRIPLRAFYCRELDCVIRRYDGWSALFDVPVSITNHRWFFLLVSHIAAQQAVLAYTMWTQLSEKLCGDTEFSAARTAYNLAMSALPCAEKPIDDSWWNYIVPSRTSYLGFWLMIVPVGMALLFLGATVRQMTPAFSGVTRAEINAPTAPSTEGGMTSIKRDNGSYVFSEGSWLYNFILFNIGINGRAWDGATAIPPQPCTGKRSNCCKK